MKTSFLDYYKIILSKVSFDQRLLQKEYGKAMSALSEPESDELVRWMNEQGLIPGSVPGQDLLRPVIQTHV